MNDILVERGARRLQHEQLGLAFPFFAHRSLAEVDETERLLLRQHVLTQAEKFRLSLLLVLAGQFNPPAAEVEVA